MKKCTRCNIQKSLEDFSFRGDFKHLKKSNCKKCDSEKSKKWRLENPEKYKIAYERSNASKDYVKEGKRRYEKDPDYYKKWYWSNDESRKKKIENKKLWIKENPKKQAEHAKNQRKNNSEHTRARDKLKKAVRDEKIIRPAICEICMTKSHKIEAHHEDYSKPLEVKWLCRPCHKEKHFKKVV